MRNKKNNRPKAFYNLKDNIHRQARVARYAFTSGFVRNKSVLEVGCGARDGPLLLSRSARKVAATDISREAIEYAKRHYRSDNIEYLMMDGASPTFHDETFEVVVALEVIEHVSDEKLFLKNIKKVLKSGGLSVLSTINRERRDFDSRNQKIPHHEKEYSFFEYQNLLKEYFTDVKISGQFLKKDIYAGAEDWRGRIKGLDSLGLRRLIPRFVKEAVLDFARAAQGATPLREVKKEDFYFAELKPEKPMKDVWNFIAICRK